MKNIKNLLDRLNRVDEWDTDDCAELLSLAGMETDDYDESALYTALMAVEMMLPGKVF